MPVAHIIREQLKWVVRGLGVSNKIAKAASILITLGLIVGFQNCAQTKFAGGDDTSFSSNNSAFGGQSGDAVASILQNGGTLPPASVDTVGGGNVTCHNFNVVTSPLKILAMVDASGSTADTDPQMSFRQDLLSAFLMNYQSKSNFQWNLDYFAGSNAYALINSGGMQNPAFSTASAMSSAISQLVMAGSNGNTPYTAALNMISKAISSDPDFASGNSNYAVAFISDGMPNPNVSDADLATLVQNIVKLKPGHITLSTVYFDKSNHYSNEAPQAIARLQAMAVIGGGQFANTISQGKNINFADVLTVPSNICN
jgi:hypothetical protein